MLLKRTALLFFLMSLLAGCAGSHQAVSKEAPQGNLTLKAAPDERKVLARNYYEEGMTHFHAGRIVKGKELLQKSLQIDPMVPQVHNNLGIIYLSRFKYKEAIAEFKEALKQKPDYQNAKFNYGLANLKADNHRESLKTFKQIKEAQGEFPRLDFYLGMSYFGLRRPGMAIKYLNKALAAEPGNAQIAYCMGVSYYQLRAYVAAEENLLKAVELEPTMNYAYYYLGTIKQTQNSFSQAAAYWKKFLEYPSEPQWQAVAEKNLNICELKFPPSD